MEAKLFKREDDFYSLKVDGIVMATSNGMLVDHKLSLKNCEVISNGYDLDELANELLYSKYPFHPSNDSGYWLDMYKEGFQKALEILGDNKFTYNQMVSAITESSISHRLPSLIIQDLQQTEWDVIVETTCDGLVTGLCIPEVCDCNIIPKLDEKGQLILKIK